MPNTTETLETQARDTGSVLKGRTAQPFNCGHPRAP